MRSHSTLLLNVTSSAGNLTMSVGRTRQVVPATLRYILSKRDQCQQSHLEVLQSKRDTYDGDAETYAESDVSKCNLNASENDPDDIHYE